MTVRHAHYITMFDAMIRSKLLYGLETVHFDHGSIEER